MRYLAIDYGERRIGLATCDDEERFASPYGVRERQGTKRDIAAILEIVRGLAIEGLVFGLPHATDGTTGNSEPAVRKFAAALENELRAANLPIALEWWDERFSTREAQAQMRVLGISQKHGRESLGTNSVDARAAAVILQGFLDRRRGVQTQKTEEISDHRVLDDGDLF
jgi:putative holliday junction resolvase